MGPDCAVGRICGGRIPGVWGAGRVGDLLASRRHGGRMQRVGEVVKDFVIRGPVPGSKS
jgi:hypothetical protein